MYTVGVSIVAQQLTNPTRIHEVVGLIPGLAQWIKDLALPCKNNAERSHVSSIQFSPMVTSSAIV